MRVVATIFIGFMLSVLFLSGCGTAKISHIEDDTYLVKYEYSWADSLPMRDEAMKEAAMAVCPSGFQVVRQFKRIKDGVYATDTWEIKCHSR